VAVAALAAVALIALGAPAQSQAAAKKHKARVMTRNLFLGADLTPGIRAKSFTELVDAAGQILNQVDQNKFQVRARGLASEILRKKPDLVGLQEAALWRTASCHVIVPPSPPTATHVRYDFLKLLLKRLNRGKRRYKLAVSQNEFDFETEANTDGSADHSCDTNVRLTMRDAILVRLHAGVRTTRRRKGHFKTLLAPKLLGAITVPVIRGWTSIDARIRGSRKFRFVNIHLEALDNQASNPTTDGNSVGNGEVREAQAKELTKKGGPATGKRPVILLGDLNSDRKTEVKPGDAKAYNWLLNVGLRERSTSKPLSCCLKGDVLTFPGAGRRSQFNHKVDHVMTNAPRKIKLLTSSVTGRSPSHGFWNSDHAGLFSQLRIP
jgi:endonuclease/exonuclease/phosphatase family protein